jgi:hypothetical protein
MMEQAIAGNPAMKELYDSYDNQGIQDMQTAYQTLYDIQDRSSSLPVKLTHRGPHQTGAGNYPQERTISANAGWYGGNTARQLMEIDPDYNPPGTEEGCICTDPDTGQQISVQPNEDGSCPCDEPQTDTDIEIPKEGQIPVPPTYAPWVQDQIGLDNAISNKWSINKYFPWQPGTYAPNIPYVLDDPTREVAAIGETADTAATGAVTTSGKQASAGILSNTQGNAARQVADAINRVHKNNITTVNQTNAANAGLAERAGKEGRTRAEKLYNDTMLTEQSYDNSMRQANQEISKWWQNMITNAANTYNMNTLTPQFNIDPTTGGPIYLTNPREFYAQQQNTPTSRMEQLKDWNRSMGRKLSEEEVRYLTSQQKGNNPNDPYYEYMDPRYRNMLMQSGWQPPIGYNPNTI